MSIKLKVNSRGKTNDCELKVEKNYNRIFQRTFRVSGSETKFEKIGDTSAPVCDLQTQNSNGLLSTVHEAFANERPLALSPDHIWAAISQAVSIHINENAEQLRHVFVDKKDKKELVVIHNQLVRGSDSSWQFVFPIFEQKLAKSIKDESFVKQLSKRFSTTGDTERIVHVVSLMDSMKQYFSYTVITRCGIPRIELLGTVQDWQQLRARAEEVCNTIGMQWWAGELLAVLDHFVLLATSPEKASQTFWSRIYSHFAASGSGVPSANGWINVFFPYYLSSCGFRKRRASAVVDRGQFCKSLANEQWWGDHSKRGWGLARERRFRASRTGCDGTASHDTQPYIGGSVETTYLCNSDIRDKQYPSGVSLVPFVWDYYGELIKMTFCGGFVTAVGLVPGSNDGCVTPVLGWAVACGQTG